MYILETILALSLLCFVYAFEPQCSTCKFFIPNIKKNDLGLCSYFQDYVYINNKRSLVKNLAIHCRANESLCGKSGVLYEPSETELHTQPLITEPNVTNESNERITKKFSGEEKLAQLEQFEKDFVDVLQQIRRHNTMRIYKTGKEIYRALKKKHI